MIGLDVGITNTDAVQAERRRMVRAIGARSGRGISKKLLSMFPQEEAVAITGAGAAGETGGLKGRDVVHVDEMGAIGIGGSESTGLNRCIVASIGTGTAIVHVRGKRCSHLGGTGVGGGTLVGLGRRILGEANPVRIAGLAARGEAHKVNITVGDVYGSGVGIVPEDATASNFGKAGGGKRDAASGVMSLVGETAGVLACFAARERKEKDIVFVGTVPEMEGMGEVLQRTASMFGFQAIVPEGARFATALGAALCREYNIYIKEKP